MGAREPEKKMNETEYMRVSALNEIGAALSVLRMSNAAICKDVNQKDLKEATRLLWDIRDELYKLTDDLDEG